MLQQEVPMKWVAVIFSTLAAFMGFSWWYVMTPSAAGMPTSVSYAKNLGVIYGEILGLDIVRNICIEQFPYMQKAIDDAYGDWAQKHKSFVQEMESRFNTFLSDDSRENGTPLATNIKFYLRKKAESKLELKNEFSKDGPEKFRNRCEIYPDFINGKAGNIETHRATELEAVRKVNYKAG